MPIIIIEVDETDAKNVKEWTNTRSEKIRLGNPMVVVRKLYLTFGDVPEVPR